MTTKLSYINFCNEIAKDYNINPNKKVKYYMTSYPIIKGKRKIHAPYNSIIVDKEGNEFPYMLSQNIRNNEKLIDFDYIYTITSKTLNEIVKQAKITLKVENCKIDEGNGWYSDGNRYYYKEFICEI